VRGAQQYQARHHKNNNELKAGFDVSGWHSDIAQTAAKKNSGQ
jgi:hypothetical protein